MLEWVRDPRHEIEAYGRDLAWHMRMTPLMVDAVDNELLLEGQADDLEWEDLEL